MNEFDKKSSFVQIHNVSKNYHTPAGDFLALDKVDLTIREGEFISIVGKSGSGKSTLINMITGIDHPSSGTVIINERNIHKQSEGEMALWRGRNMGIVFQFFQLLPMLSVLENTMLPMDFCNTYEIDHREKIAMDLLRRLGLEELANQLPLEISGGHQQCAAIARALANDPPILLADEPTGNLDSKTAEMVLSIFADLKKREKTIIMVTHDKGLARRADRTLILSDGCLVSEEISNALPNISDTVLAGFDKVKVEIKLIPGESLSKHSPENIWFGLIKNGSLTRGLNGINRLIKKEIQYGCGEFFEFNPHFEQWCATEESLIWLFPSDFKKQLPADVIGLVDTIKKSKIKGHQR